MGNGRIRRERGGPATRLLALVLVGLLLLLPLDSASWPFHPAHHDGLDQSLNGEVVAGLQGNLTLYDAPADGQAYRLLVDVVVDEEFVAQVGQGWEAEARSVVSGANTLLQPVGLALETASVRQWPSPDAEDAMAVLLQDAAEQAPGASGRLLLAITCQDTVKYDGWARESSRGLIVRFYHEHRERNATLVAHEIGHLLGAHHHEDEEQCDEDGCLMDEGGYAHGTRWCEHHTQVIQDRLQSLAVAW